MAGTEADGRCAGVDVVPVVVVLGDSQVSGIFGAVGVAVANQRCLPVVVDVAVGDCDEVCGVGEINQAVVVVLVMVPVGRDINMVDPDVGGELDSNGITVCSKNLLDRQVPDDDVLLALHKTN